MGFVCVMKFITKDNRILWLICSAIVLVFLGLLVISFNSYYRNKHHFKEEVEDVVGKVIYNYHAELLEKGSRGVISSRDSTTFWIIRDERKNVHDYDSGEKIRNHLDHAIYDILPPDAWNIKNLAAFIRHELSVDCPPFKLIRIDSIGNVLDSCRWEITKYPVPSLEYEYTVPLGFLDKHELKVYYTYPWHIFWREEGKNLFIIFLLLTLFFVCTFILIKRLYDARKKVKNQELLQQALNHNIKSPVELLKLQEYQIKCNSVSPYSEKQEELYGKSMNGIKKILIAADHFLQNSIDIQGVHLNMEEVDLQKIIGEQIAMVKAEQEGKKKVEITTSFQLPDPIIQADALHLSQVIWNLLENAVKYSDTEVNIRISCRSQGRFVEIVIEDKGQGIEKKEIKHIFDRNYRTYAHKNSKVHGFGLGLSYVKMIVKAHKGTIQVESEPEEGTTFIIKLKYGKKN